MGNFQVISLKFISVHLELDSLLNNQQTYGVEHPPNPLSAPKHVSLEESAVIETEKPNEELL